MLQDFHKTFEVGIYIQKSGQLAISDIFIYIKPGTSHKARQFDLRFYIKILVT